MKRLKSSKAVFVFFFELLFISIFFSFRALEQKVNAKMAERSDYQAYYYRPVIAKYHRVSKEAADYLETIRGD